MAKTILYVFILLILTGAVPSRIELIAFHVKGSAQGTTYHITYYAQDNLVAKSEIDSILNVIDSSLSLYKPYSLVNRFNKSNRGIILDLHMRNVVKKSIEVFQTTSKIFDITVYPYTNAWGFGTSKVNDGPSATRMRALKKCVGSDKIKLLGDSLIKFFPCTQLDPNGIAQGYSVDVLATFLQERGINNYIVELGGELSINGRKQPDNTKMKIAIESPGQDDWDISATPKMIIVDRGALTTSGSYRKFRESKGKKITHLIDARTGYPVMNELLSVTVYAKDAITADAYDNALMVMGLGKAIAFTEKRKDIAAYFIFKRKDGSVADTCSREFKKLLIKPDNF